MDILNQSEDFKNEMRNEAMYKTGLKYVDDILIKRQQINKNCSSYGLKHELSDYILKAKDEEENDYLSNEVFILIMHDKGFECKKCRDGSPNYYFNFSYKRIYCCCGGHFNYKTCNKEYHDKSKKHLNYFKK